MSKWTNPIRRKNVVFEMNESAVAGLLKSQEVEECLLENAKELAKSSGSGYKAKQMDTRVIVVPDTAEAEQDNYENNTLVKGIS